MSQSDGTCAFRAAASEKSMMNLLASDPAVKQFSLIFFRSRAVSHMLAAELGGAALPIAGRFLQDDPGAEFRCALCGLWIFMDFHPLRVVEVDSPR